MYACQVETPILWPPHTKNWLIGKDSDAGRDWGQEEKGMTEDEMAGWHHRFDGHEFEWTPGVGDGQGGLACYNSWGRKESDTTERLNWTDHLWLVIGFSGGSVVKNLLTSAGDSGDACSIPRLGRSPGGGNGNPLQYCCLENITDRGAWLFTVHGVTKSQTRLNMHAQNHCAKLVLHSWATGIVK